VKLANLRFANFTSLTRTCGAQWEPALRGQSLRAKARPGDCRRKYSLGSWASGDSLCIFLLGKMICLPDRVRLLAVIPALHLYQIRIVFRSIS